MNDVVYNWIDLLVFLAAMTSCGTVVGLACWALNIAAMYRVKRTGRAARVQRKQWQEIPKMNTSHQPRPRATYAEEPLPSGGERRTSDAILAAAVGVSTQSLARILSTCLPMVRERASRISAISQFRLPWPIQRRTSASRFVRPNICKDQA